MSFTIDSYDENYKNLKDGYQILEVKPIDGVRQFEVVKIPEPTEVEQKENIKSICSAYINDISWRVERYNTQKELGVETSDTAETYIKILQYMQYLRAYDNAGQWWMTEPKKFDEFQGGD